MTPDPQHAAPNANARPEFACVIPAYNRAGTVARAIQSALDQSWPPREIIVVDDGSKDATADAVAAFGDRVRYVYQENAGAAAARNRGLHLATSEWVALLDSDDYWTPNHLQVIAEAIQATQGAAILYFADTQRPETEGSVSQWERARFAIDGPHELNRSASEWVLRERIPMMLQASVFHRERFCAHGGLWEALPMRDDTHAFLSLGIAHPICAVQHLGVMMTADDRSGGRLTTAVGNKTARYWKLSILMWRDLLQRGTHLTPEQRGLLRRRLAVAHLRVARHAWQERQLGAIPGHLLQAIWASPKRVMSTLFGRLGRRSGEVSAA